MSLFASVRLRLKERRSPPIREASEAHRLLESGDTRDSIFLIFDCAPGTSESQEYPLRVRLLERCCFRNRSNFILT